MRQRNDIVHEAKPGETFEGPVYHMYYTKSKRLLFAMEGTKPGDDAIQIEGMPTAEWMSEKMKNKENFMLDVRTTRLFRKALRRSGNTHQRVLRDKAREKERARRAALKCQNSMN